MRLWLEVPQIEVAAAKRKRTPGLFIAGSASSTLQRMLVCGAGRHRERALKWCFGRVFCKELPSSGRSSVQALARVGTLSAKVEDEGASGGRELGARMVWLGNGNID